MRQSRSGPIKRLTKLDITIHKYVKHSGYDFYFEAGNDVFRPLLKYPTRNLATAPPGKYSYYSKYVL